MIKALDEYKDYERATRAAVGKLEGHLAEELNRAVDDLKESEKNMRREKESGEREEESVRADSLLAEL